MTTVPTQALFLMNNPFVLRQADEMARHILADKGLNQADANRFGLSPGVRPAGHGSRRKSVASYSARISPGPQRRRPEGQCPASGLGRLLPDTV